MAQSATDFLEATDPEVAPDPETFVARATGYHPVPAGSPDYKMEGGFTGADEWHGQKFDAEERLYTLDQYRRGQAPYVSVAMDNTTRNPYPYGTVLRSPDMPGVLFRVMDTGSHFKGKGTDAIDIARDDKAGANATENNRHLRFQPIGEIPYGTPVDLQENEVEKAQPVKVEELEVRRAKPVNGQPHAQPTPEPDRQTLPSAEQILDEPEEETKTEATAQPSAADFLDAPETPAEYGTQFPTGQELNAMAPAGEVRGITQPLYQPKKVTAGDPVADVDPSTGRRLGSTHPASNFEAAATNLVNGFISGATSVKGLLGFLPPVFLAQTIAQAPDTVRQVQAAEKTPPFSQERWETGLGVALTLGTAGLMGHSLIQSIHAAAPKPVQEKFGLADIKIPTTGGGESSAETIRSDAGQVRQGSQTGQPPVQTGPVEGRPDLQQQTQTPPSGTGPVETEPPMGWTPPERRPGSAWPGVAFMDQVRIKGRLGELGYHTEQIDAMSRAELQAIDLEAPAKTVPTDAVMMQPEPVQASGQEPKPELAPSMSANDFLDAPETVSGFAPRPARKLTREQLAEQQARQEMLAAGREAIEAQGGIDILDAVDRAGGLPLKGAPQHLRGELEALRSAAGKGGMYNKIFSKRSPGEGKVLQSVQGRGFNIQTSDELYERLAARLRTGRPDYGLIEATEALYGSERAERVAEEPPELIKPKEMPFNLRGEELTEEPSAEGTARRQAEAAAEQKRQQLTLLEVAPKDIESYASTHGLQDVPAAKEAVAQVFARARNLSAGRYEQPELFAAPRRAGPATAGRALSPREIGEVLKAKSPAAAKEAFAKGDTISSILPKLVRREIPGFNLRGKIINSPQDFVLLTQALRTPYFESVKLAFLDENNAIVHSPILHVGTVDQSVFNMRDVIKAYQDAKAIAKETGHKVKGMIAAHNHPSGDPTPSSSGDLVIEQIVDRTAKRVGLPVLDHIVTEGQQYYSRSAGGVQFLSVPHVAPWEVVPRGQLRGIRSPADLSEYARFFRQVNPDATHLFYANTKLNITGVERVPAFAQLSDLTKRVLNGAAREGARFVFVDVRPGDTDPYATVTGLANHLQQTGVEIRDASSSQWDSYNEHIAKRGMGPDLRQKASETFIMGEPVVRETPPSQSDFEAAANDPRKMHQHVDTIKRMIEVSQPVKDLMQNYYDPTTDKIVNQRAIDMINSLGLQAARERFRNEPKSDDNVMALGHHVALRLDALGDTLGAATVRDEMIERSFDLGRGMWYLSTIAKTSPEGLIATAQKVVTDTIKADPEKAKLLEEIERLKGQLAKLPTEKGRTAATEAVIRQLAKVNKPGQRLSPAQLDDLLTKHTEGRLKPDELAGALKNYFNVPQLTPENIAKIKAAQKAWADVPDDNALLKMHRAMDMMDSIYGLVPPTLWDKVRAVAVMSMILHGRLPVRIGVSNVLQMLGQTAADTFNAIALDPMLSVFTGKRTVTGPQLKARLSGIAEFPVKTFGAGYEAARAQGLNKVQSFKEGMRTMVELASATTKSIQDMDDMRGRTTHILTSRLGKLAENTVSLVHNVVPASFWNGAYKASIARQLAAARQSVPTAEMIANARLDANKAIFTNETAAYEMLKMVRKTLDYPTRKITQGKYGLGTATVPFAKVPGAILTEGATWTPLGFVRGGYELFRPVITKEPFDQKAFVDAFAKATMGTGSLVSTGYWLAKLGIISGSKEENKDLEAMRKATGHGQYRVNVSELKRRFLSGDFWSPMREPYGQDGDLTLAYNWIEPLAFPVSMGADIAHSQDKREVDLKKGKITSNAAISAAAAGAETLATHPMMQGLEEFEQTRVEQGLAPAFVDLASNIPGNFIPSLARQTAQLIDNTVRDTRGGSQLERSANRLAVQLPWISQKYPARYDVFGEAVQRYNYGRNTLINVFFNPAQPQILRKNENVNELMNLFKASADSKVLPGQVARKITINGKQVELDNDQLATYQRYVGQLSSAGVARLFASPEFAAEPTAVKQQLITKMLEAVHQAAKIDLFGEPIYHVSKAGQVRITAPYSFAQIQAAHLMDLNKPAPSGPIAAPTPPPATRLQDLITQ